MNVNRLKRNPFRLVMPRCLAKSFRPVAACFGIAFLMQGLVSQVLANGPVAAGDDVWVTPCGGGTVDFQPIPAGFFTSNGGASSLVYSEGIELGGAPLAINPPVVPAADIDTVVRRLTPTSVGFGIGSSETVGLQIVALHLTSCQPINIVFDDLSVEQWNVSVCLTDAQSTGSMVINHGCPEGGTYITQLPVRTQLTFARVGGGAGSPLTLTPIDPIDFDSFGWWTHTDSGLNLSRLAPLTQFDDGCDGIVDPGDPTTVNGPSADFFAGLYNPTCGVPGPIGPVLGCCEPTKPFCEDVDCFTCVVNVDPGCSIDWLPHCADIATTECLDVCPCGPPPGGVVKPAINPEQAALAKHGLAIANPGKNSGGNGGVVLTEACCNPQNSPLTCIDVTPADCVNIYAGTPQGPGTHCNTTVCNPPQYENWVIADDFALNCPDCQCDLNADGICDTQDELFLLDCAANPAPGCSVADLDCDGTVSGIPGDWDVWNCLAGGAPPSACCPNPTGNFTIDRVRWYGSYFDPDFEPPTDGTPPLRRPDAWLLAIHSDIPPQACPTVPAGFAPFDLCGTLIQGVEAGCTLLQPIGTTAQYLLQGSLGGSVPGDQVRICGYVDPTNPTTCMQGLGPVVVQSVLTCDSAISRPDRLIAQWAIPDALVGIENTGKVGCDGHRNFGYTTNLSDGCLMHNFAEPDEIDPLTGNFKPRAGVTYWLSIQPEVGHAVDLATCQEILTGESLTREFWGWHTTPPGYHNKDDAYVGMLEMGCPDEWIYNWMNHLHWSDPPFIDCADDPTKSIDMAFYLISTSSTGVESSLWCQPLNPGPQPPTSPPVIDDPIPGGGVDEFADTIAEITVTLFNPPTIIQATLRGPTIVTRTNPQEVMGFGEIQTEIIEMQLNGIGPVGVGPMTLRLNPDQRSMGLARTQQPGNDFPVDSFFDVWINIDLPALGLTLATQMPVRIDAPLQEIPPSNTSYNGPDNGPIFLFDTLTGDTIGELNVIQHILPYRGGVNIHSDADWASIPTGPCCEPTTDGTACEPITCPDATEQCQPRCIIFDELAGTQIVDDCDCRPATDCRAEIGPIPGGPTCAGVCPPNQTCVETVTQISPGVQRICCDCITPILTGACCFDADGDTINESCSITTASACAALPGGSYAGDGSTCLGTEACCFTGPLGPVCQDMDQLCCSAIGTPGGTGSTCQPEGACCFDSTGDGINDSCSVMAEACCDDVQGTFQGAGSACQGTGACCFGIAGVGCIEVDGACCDDLLGTFQGVGSTCIDGDNNGTADVCESLCPEPDNSTLCAALQDTQCMSNDPLNQFCLPTQLIVTHGPVSLDVMAESCDCFNTGADCGPIQVTPIAGADDYNLVCDGICLNPPPGEFCQIHIGGSPTGQTQGLASQFADQGTITCECAPEVCLTIDDCIDMDVCTFDDCVDSSYTHLVTIYGDVVGLLGACSTNDIVDVFDVTAVLDAFSGASFCHPLQADIAGMFGACVPNGAVDVFDVINVLDAFSGIEFCICAGPSPSSPSGGITERAALQAASDTPAGSVRISLMPASRVIKPSEELRVDVVATGVSPIRGYQFIAIVQGGQAGSLELMAATIDPQSGAHLFDGLESVWAGGSDRLVSATVNGAGVKAGRASYLGTIILRASKDAAGEFQVSLGDAMSVMIVSPSRRLLTVEPIQPVHVTVR